MHKKTIISVIFVIIVVFIYISVFRGKQISVANVREPIQTEAEILN